MSDVAPRVRRPDGYTRKVVWTLHQAGLSHKLIARQVGIAPSSVANALKKERNARGIPADPRGRRAPGATTP